MENFNEILVFFFCFLWLLSVYTENHMHHSAVLLRTLNRNTNNEYKNERDTFLFCAIFGKSTHKYLPANNINVSPVVWKNKVWIFQ